MAARSIPRLTPLASVPHARLGPPQVGRCAVGPPRPASWLRRDRPALPRGAVRRGKLLSYWTTEASQDVAALSAK